MNTINETYTALTIGPIISSLAQARKVRELWAASFLFSFISEKIIEELLNSGVGVKDFVLPFPKARDLDIGSDHKKAGVFPDRIIIRHENGFKKMTDAVNSTVKKVKAEFGKANHKPEDEVEDYVNRYFRTNIIETEIADGQNVIIEINKLLACSELKHEPIFKDEQYFLRFLQGITKTDLYRNAVGKSPFPSIIEIATRGLGVDNRLFHSKEQNEENDDGQIWENIKGHLKENNRSGELRTAHKYIAIVSADGDNVGKLIESIYKNDSDKIEPFSKALSQFSFDAVKLISEYGGEPVYAGGDDLLFFAPVVAKDGNIFTLIDAIDDIFKQRINSNTDLSDVLKESEKQPSLSFGLSVTYYKYPMGEALSEAYRLLFGKAKSTGNKNNIAYTLQKHSGQLFSDVILKDPGDGFYSRFKTMLNNDQDRLISSLLYNLEEQKVILGEIATDQNRLKSFFDNFYDEDIHKKNQIFIHEVRDMIFDTHGKRNDIDHTLKKVYSALRFVKFINRKNDE